MNKFEFQTIEPLFESYQIDLIKSENIDSLFEVILDKEESEGNMETNIVVYKGAQVPITRKLISNLSDIENPAITRVEVVVKNTVGGTIQSYNSDENPTIVSIDNLNNLALFKWDTSELESSQYTINMWIYYTYNDVDYKDFSGNIYRVVRDISTIKDNSN